MRNQWNINFKFALFVRRMRVHNIAPLYPGKVACFFSVVAPMCDACCRAAEKQRNKSVKYIKIRAKNVSARA